MSDQYGNNYLVVKKINTNKRTISLTPLTADKLNGRLRNQIFHNNKAILIL